MKDKLLAIYRHPLLKSTAIYIAFDALSNALPFLLLPILSFYLLPAEYGLVSNFGVINGIVIVLISVGVDGAISSSFFTYSKEKLSEYISNALILVFVFFIVVSISLLLLKDSIYDYTKISFKYQFLAVLVAFSSVITNINLVLWRLEEKPINFGTYRLFQTILNVGITLWLVVGLVMGWKGRIIGIASGSILFGLISFFYLSKRGYLSFKIKKEYLRDLLMFGLPLIPHGLGIWIRFSIDKIFITSLIGETANGLYSTGFQFGLLMSFVILAFNNAYVPFLFKKLSEPNHAKLIIIKRNLVKITYALLLLYLIISLLFTEISYLLIDNVLSSKYQESRIFVFWVMLAQVFQGYYLLFGNYAFFIKKTKMFAVITFSCALIQLFLSYFLISEIGVMGAAYSTVIVSFINFVAVAIFSMKVYDMPWFGFKSNLNTNNTNSKYDK
jgi:O-antigen/teichoic acid export membrane protein